MISLDLGLDTDRATAIFNRLSTEMVVSGAYNYNYNQAQNFERADPKYWQGHSRVMDRMSFYMALMEYVRANQAHTVAPGGDRE